MKKLTTILLFILLSNVYSIERDTLIVNNSKVVVNLDKIHAFRNDTTTKFIMWKHGFYKVSETVVHKDSVFTDDYKYKYSIGDTIIYVNYL